MVAEKRKVTFETAFSCEMWFPGLPKEDQIWLYTPEVLPAETVFQIPKIAFRTSKLCFRRVVRPPLTVLYFLSKI